MRDAELVGDRLRVADGVERAAGPVGDVAAVAKEPERGADDVVALLDEEGRRHGAVDAARHGHENPTPTHELLP